MIPANGSRVRVTGIMPNDPCPMEVGAEGTVVDTNLMPVGWGPHQIYVEWDNGRSLILLSTDPFIVVSENAT